MNRVVTASSFPAVVARLEVRMRRQWCAPETLTPATDLRVDLGVDSMDATDLAMLLEDETGVILNDEEMRCLETLGQLANCLAAKRTAGVGERCAGRAT